MQRPLPAMDVLETAGIKKFPLSCLEDLRFCSLLTNFKLVPGLVTICHLLVAVLYLLLWSFALLVFKKYWFPLQSKNNTSQYLCSAAKSCEGREDCFLVLGSSSLVSWQLVHHRDVTCLSIFLGALFPRGALIGSFSVCRCVLALLFLQRNAQDPFLSCHFFFTAVLAARAGPGWR